MLVVLIKSAVWSETRFLHFKVNFLHFIPDDPGRGEVASSYFSSHLNHVSKKSRKQTIPKKINRPCRDEVGTNRPEIESETSVVGPEFENKLTSLNETYNSSLDSSYALDMDFLQKSECQNMLRDKGQLSHEKSRKQSIPKRKIDQLAVLPNIAGKKEIEKPMLNGTYSSAEQKHVKCRKQNTPRKIVQEFSIADSVSSSKGKVYDEDIRSCNVDNQDIEDFLSEDSKESLASNPNVDNTSANPDHTDDHTNIFTSPYFPNLDLEKPEESFVTPELARLSQQIALQAELLAKLSQNHIQLAENLNNDSAPSARGGLEFVKKLREVRVNRYRKISIDVKKHIAGFAKVHGVSVAANHFGVSKSAVSLWNRTDFTEKDEELEKRKRNCFIGNEKFENLVQRVKLEKATKFKYLSREDKVEVAKYAKLVGVREMSRCLNMALGTVSGWMRQYPYDVVAKTETIPADAKKCDDEFGNNQIPNDIKTMIEKSSLMNDKECGVSGNIPVKPECNANIPRDTIDNELEEYGSYKLKGYDNLNIHVKDSLLKGSDQKSDIYEKHGEYIYERLMSSSVSKENETNGFHSPESSKDLNSKILKLSAESENDNQHNNVEMAVTENSSNMKQNVDLGIDHDLESLIASSFVKPDLDKCFAEVKEQIVGTVLEDDAYFEHLFKRVTETRIDKYKSLKRSEKLEIVRYAKRIGVRRVAKIMDLATGTLSGWIIKYQHLLGLVSNVNADNHVDSSNQSDIEVDTGNVSATTESEITQITENQEKHVNLLLQSPSSILDNKDSTEVTALKFLLKERFPLLQEKINVARKVKFKNLNIGEKLELVKCAKLVGIRPTARVFQMPLGTLSGWISKYSCFLEPEFHGVSQGSATCATSNSWLINRLDNSLGRLNESDISTGVSLRTAPHLQWTAAEDRSDETDRSESPYSKMMNEMAEKSFSNKSHLFPSSYNADMLNSQTNILNRRLSIDWPTLSSQQSTDLSWPRLKLPNGQTEEIRVSNPDNGSPHFLLHDYSDSSNEESTKAMAQQYMKQFGMVQFADM